MLYHSIQLSVWKTNLSIELKITEQNFTSREHYYTNANRRVGISYILDFKSSKHYLKELSARFIERYTIHGFVHGPGTQNTWRRMTSPPTCITLSQSVAQPHVCSKYESSNFDETVPLPGKKSSQQKQALGFKSTTVPAQDSFCDWFEDSDHVSTRCSHRSNLPICRILYWTIQVSSQLTAGGDDAVHIVHLECQHR